MGVSGCGYVCGYVCVLVCVCVCVCVCVREIECVFVGGREVERERQREGCVIKDGEDERWVFVFTVCRSQSQPVFKALRYHTIPRVLSSEGLQLSFPFPLYLSFFLYHYSVSLSCTHFLSYTFLCICPPPLSSLFSLTLSLAIFPLS